MMEHTQPWFDKVEERLETPWEREPYPSTEGVPNTKVRAWREEGAIGELSRRA